jgi:ABC-2 type transport system permease protein
MNRALLKKSIHDAKWLLLASAAAIFAFCWIRVWIVSRLDTGRFKAILDLLPGDWKRFSPVDFDWLITYTGRISLTFDEPIVVFGILIWAIARGSDCISGELSRGTMEMLVSQPVSRLKVLLTQSTVTVIGTALLALTAWLGTYAGIQTGSVKEEIAPTWQSPIYIPLIGTKIPKPYGKPEIVRSPMSEKVDAEVFLPAIVNLFALGFFFCGLTTFMSSWDRYRWRTIGIVASICVVQLIVKIVGMASDDLNWLMYASIFTAFEPEAFVSVAATTPEYTWSLLRYDAQGQWIDYGPLWYDLILYGFGWLGYVAAASIFIRRDLPAPL